MKCNDASLDGDVSLAAASAFNTPFSATLKPEDLFTFLDLPAEIRLQIYGYLLPSRTHTIVTQSPYNGFFFNTATLPANSAQSFYPFGRSPPRDRLTTYKVLSTNFRASYPSPSIHVEIFRTCKQIRAEAEPILYGGQAIFDFGIHLDAVKSFFGDRSALARASVRNIKIAKEIPEPVTHNSGEWQSVLKPGVDQVWREVCDHLLVNLQNLKNIDLTVWAPSGSVSVFPALIDTTAAPSTESVLAEAQAEASEQARLWREWEWTSDLLKLEVLKGLRITWWGFNSQATREGTTGFDSWLARRMIGDGLVRDRMVREGLLIEGLVVVNGTAT
ncbi:hypothetical protein BP5796_00143 [Coleophoma crateriformis]|uniref:DUF7730 domain-containing protein n=1 Tax=Coleophoma crateriformis TaxID=565419 RepID=A0A3D8T771_9HELO|nr:hypothetical protein BP5796_00143 [Coleophoma crateriformis]